MTSGQHSSALVAVYILRVRCRTGLHGAHLRNPLFKPCTTPSGRPVLVYVFPDHARVASRLYARALHIYLADRTDCNCVRSPEIYSSCRPRSSSFIESSRSRWKGYQRGYTYTASTYLRLCDVVTRCIYMFLPANVHHTWYPNF